MPRGNNKNLFLLSVLKGLTYILGFPSIFKIMCALPKKIFCDSASSDSVRVTTLNAVRRYILRIFSKKDRILYFEVRAKIASSFGEIISQE